MDAGQVVGMKESNVASALRDVCVGVCSYVRTEASNGGVPVGFPDVLLMKRTTGRLVELKVWPNRRSREQVLMAEELWELWGVRVWLLGYRAGRYWLFDDGAAWDRGDWEMAYWSGPKRELGGVIQQLFK